MEFGGCMKRRINLIIEKFCDECPYCHLEMNYLNYNRSKFLCHHPENNGDIIATLEEVKKPTSDRRIISDNCPLEKIE